MNHMRIIFPDHSFAPVIVTDGDTAAHILDQVSLAEFLCNFPDVKTLLSFCNNLYDWYLQKSFGNRGHFTCVGNGNYH